MTRRARWYLSVAAARHLSLGLFCLLAPWLFSNAAFIPILDFLPIWAWGIVMVVAGGFCVTAALLRSGSWARLGMVTSAVITFVLAAGVSFGVSLVWYAWANHIPGAPPAPASPVLPILLLALAAKDFIVTAQPIRSPFETVVKQIATD